MEDKMLWIFERGYWPEVFTGESVDLIEELF
jgi:hypothetical protein